LFFVILVVIFVARRKTASSKPQNENRSKSEQRRSRQPPSRLPRRINNEYATIPSSFSDTDIPSSSNSDSSFSNYVPLVVQKDSTQNYTQLILGGTNTASSSSSNVCANRPIRVDANDYLFCTTAQADEIVWRRRRRRSGRRSGRCRRRSSGY